VRNEYKAVHQEQREHARRQVDENGNYGGNRLA
jgi:hypothetical protein